MPRKLILSGIMLILGILLAGYGASALFQAGVAADESGLPGAAAPLPLGAAIVGTICTVTACCVIVWTLAELRDKHDPLDS